MTQNMPSRCNRGVDRAVKGMQAGRQAGIAMAIEPAFGQGDEGMSFMQPLVDARARGPQRDARAAMAGLSMLETQSLHRLV